MDAGGAAVEDVGVDHGGADIAVAEQLLHGANIGPVLEQVSGEGVAEGVAAGPLGEAGLADGPFTARWSTDSCR